jgi:hypothetical protein
MNKLAGTRSCSFPSGTAFVAFYHHFSHLHRMTLNWAHGQLDICLFMALRWRFEGALRLETESPVTFHTDSYKLIEPLFSNPISVSVYSWKSRHGRWPEALSWHAGCVYAVQGHSFPRWLKCFCQNRCVCVCEAKLSSVVTTSAMGFEM